MAKRNEGDIMEGIFSIGLADLFANNSVSRGRINTVRAKIDTKLFQTGAFNYQYSSKEVPPDPDIVEINLSVRLKQGSTWEAYGPEWKMMYDRVGDIGELDKKIQQIIDILNTNYRERIIKAKNVWLKNNESDEVKVDIIADGQEGEKTKGMLKGDIMIQINMNGDNIIDEEMIFSLKSGSATVQGGSPYKGLLDIVGRLGIKMPVREAKYRRLLGDLLVTARTEAEKRAKVKLSGMFFEDVMKGMDTAARTNPRKFKKELFNIMRSATFGQDLADVIDVDKTTIKETTPAYIDKLESTTGNLRVENAPSGYNLYGGSVTGRRVFMTGPNAPKGHLLQFRFKFRAGNNIYKELKLMMILGGGAYMPKASKTGIKKR